MSKKIAVIGECMIELSQKGAEVSRGFGGDTLNTSVYIARQVAPEALTVNYVTALGTDSFSQQMLEAWQSEHVETSLIQRMENRLPGLYYIETDSTGERTFYYWRNEAAAKFWLESEDAAAICEADDEVDALFSSTVLELCSQISRDSAAVPEHVDFMFIAKYIERMADHATNIAEWAIFIDTGVHPNLNDTQAGK